MSILIAERRMDKNGRLVTKHIRPQQASPARLSLVPAPTVAPEVPELVEYDDLNVMATLGVYDYDSSACEKVETYLEDEYGAFFGYNTEDGIETVSFETNDDAERFRADFYEGGLREELREIAEAA